MTEWFDEVDCNDNVLGKVSRNCTMNSKGQADKLDQDIIQ